MITIFITGGTFDKEYEPLTGELSFQKTHVPEMMTLGRCSIPTEVTTLMMKDSLHMTPEDRQIVLKACESSANERVIITHGTDTMVETAKVLASAKLPKTIILTGALIPYKFGSSDGFFNLGCAIAYAQTLPHGVYIAMNGQYLDWDNSKKNKQTGYFEALF
ncbi:MAG: asparaginase domain-containing protein [Candidatus Altimarinota bacterium]